MPYYIWKRGDKIVAYDHTSEHRPPPAIEVSAEEAKELGFYVTPAGSSEPVGPAPTEEDDTAAMLVDHEYRLTLMELGLTGGES